MNDQIQELSDMQLEQVSSGKVLGGNKNDSFTTALSAGLVQGLLQGSVLSMLSPRGGAAGRW